MVIRSAVGALGVVAVLGAVALALPEHGGSKSPVAAKKDPPFGVLRPSDIVSSGTGVQATPGADETAKLLKLAVTAGPPAPATPPLSSPAPSPTIPVVAAVATSGQVVPSLTATTAPSTSDDQQAPSRSASSAVQAVQSRDTTETDTPKTPPEILAFADPAPSPLTTAPAATPAPLPPRKQDRAGVDINKASEDTLDHLPGAGRIGRAIVRHRPYRKIEDLVQKRVLRMTAFQRIQSLIKVD